MARLRVNLVDFFKLHASCVINKYDLNERAGEEIAQFCGEKGIDLINTIPYSRLFSDLLQDGKTIAEADDPELRGKITEIWNHLEKEQRS